VTRRGIQPAQGRSAVAVRLRADCRLRGVAVRVLLYQCSVIALHLHLHLHLRLVSSLSTYVVSEQLAGSCTQASTRADTGAPAACGEIGFGWFSRG
jgi:hypothetical protein